MRAFNNKNDDHACLHNGIPTSIFYHSPDRWVEMTVLMESKTASSRGKVSG